MVSTNTRTGLLETTASATRGNNDSRIHGYPHILDTGIISMFGVISGQSLSQQQASGNLQIQDPFSINDVVPNRGTPTMFPINRPMMSHMGMGRIQLLRRYLDAWSLGMPSRPGPTNLRISGSLTWVTETIDPYVAPRSDLLDIKRRLTELRDLKDGWADGMQNVRDWGSGFGKAPSQDGLDWLAAQFERFYPNDAPRPRIYPTPEGGVQVEWSLGDLEIDIDAHTAEWFSADLNADSSEERILNLDNPTDWQWVTNQLRRDAS